MGAVYFRLLLECSCSQSEAAGASPSEVALEFRGDGIAVDLGDCFADVGFGVSPFFQGAHVFADFLIVRGHFVDRFLPILRLSRELPEWDLDVENILDSLKEGHCAFGLGGCET